jgi:hypothetical protein
MNLKNTPILCLLQVALWIIDFRSGASLTGRFAGFKSWADGLDYKTRGAFLNMPVRNLIGQPVDYLGYDFALKLGKEKRFEIAATNMIIGEKQ